MDMPKVSDNLHDRLSSLHSRLSTCNNNLESILNEVRGNIVAEGPSQGQAKAISTSMNDKFYDIEVRIKDIETNIHELGTIVGTGSNLGSVKAVRLG